MTFRSTLLGTVAALTAMSGAQVAQAQMDQITVAYFMDWPLPFLVSKNDGTYEEELGVSINWVAFDTGTAMSAAMASGDVQIAVSQGVPPFVVATSAGQDLKAVDVAVSYSDNDNCVVASNLEIDKTNTADLEGKRVAVPIGTAAHYGFLAQMQHFGVDVSTMEIVDMAPPEGAAAFAQGALDMVCGYGGSLDTMKEYGNVLLTGDEKEEVGILVFDVTSAPAQFVAEAPDLLADFLRVTAEVNERWNSGEEAQAEMLPIMAQEAGLTEEAAMQQAETFRFPTVEEQLGERWLGGGAQDFMQGVAGVFTEAGSIPSSLETYEDTVDTGPLQRAQDGSS
ncbi:ABC transporter substrate-binding protein [uncultured Jannaschia sp.]|uniref:taurine ABC transporter substrate-binding protein n=1 Tax=uncultured Jannaschia sp. TaxID=293347 RepID=UPI002631E695|nr:ABC transporter substrate-binding protein [uncultured Jannaschia sp.]